MSYIAVRGIEKPNDENGDYQITLDLLYGIAYTIKMSNKNYYKINVFLNMLFRH